MTARVRRVLVIACHPEPNSLLGTATTRAVEGFRSGGHEVRVIDLYNIGDTASVVAPITIAEHRAALDWCEVLVLAAPTWWGGQPALMKAWIDAQVRNGSVWRNIRDIIVITTHGSSKRVNALQGEPGKRIVSRGLRPRCHRWCRVHRWALYAVDTRPPSSRHAYLDRIAARATRWR